MEWGWIPEQPEQPQPLTTQPTDGKYKRTRIIGDLNSIKKKYADMNQQQSTSISDRDKKQGEWMSDYLEYGNSEFTTD
jgi:hypothetical protein